ncbi:hypothetical protein ACREYP_09690 [Enterobacter sp. TMH.L2]
MGEGRGEGRLLLFFLSHPDTNLTHQVVLFLGHRPNHSGKLHLVANHRRAAEHPQHKIT